VRAASPRSLGLALAASALALMLAAGCSATSRPYRFSSPLLGGAELPDGRRGLDEEARRPRREGKPRRQDEKRAAVAMQEVRGPSRSKKGEALAPKVSLGADADPQDPRSWVGARDDSDPVLAVLALCKRRHERCPETGPSRQDWRPPETEFGVGDLLLFERVGLDNRESLVALVTARQSRGVYELAYLAAGVWRRGLIDPSRPRLHKDKEGRIVNTFLRHRRAAPPSGTRFLSGELLVGVIRLRDRERQPPQVAAK
jgi:hypothetical protein